MIQLTINGTQHKFDIEPDTPLLWAIRDTLGLTGTKYSCGKSLCGSCTVHVDGIAMRSCAIPVSALSGKSITTIEGLKSKTAKAVQSAWEKMDVVQCGFCQSGQIMSAIGLLEQNKDPSDDDINGAMGGNICRCNTYVRIRAAIKAAAKELV